MFVLLFLVLPVTSKVLIREFLFENSSYNLQDSPYDITGETIIVHITINYVVLAYMVGFDVIEKKIL